MKRKTIHTVFVLTVIALMARSSLLWAGPPEEGEQKPSPLNIPKTGSLLVATSNINSPPFSRSVVLLVNYGPDGAMGVIVNKPTPIPLHSVMPGAKALQGSDELLFYGGPVSRNIFTVLMESDKEMKEGDGVAKVFGNVFFVADRTIILRSLEERNNTVRGFSGYCGWAPGQLESELARGDWLVKPSDSEAVFSKRPGALWRRFHHRVYDGVWAFGPGSSGHGAAQTGYF